MREFLILATAVLIGGWILNANVAANWQAPVDRHAIKTAYESAKRDGDFARAKREANEAYQFRAIRER